MKVKIAVVQLDVKQFEPEENLKRAESFIARASKKGANVIVFPEGFITGSIRLQKSLADENHEYHDHMKELAVKYNIDIVAGTIVEKEKTGLYNTSYYIDSSGKIRAKYRKINLWLSERSYVNSGNQVCVFNTRYGKAGIAVCWDLAFPEIFRRMARKGVNIVYCPSWWYLTYMGKKFMDGAEIRHVDALCVARAFENEIILVYCNSCGKSRGKGFSDMALGRSQIAVPFKGAVKRLEHNKEEMFVQEVDTNILKIAEKNYKIRNDLKNRVL